MCPMDGSCRSGLITVILYAAKSGCSTKAGWSSAEGAKPGEDQSPRRTQHQCPEPVEEEDREPEEVEPGEGAAGQG